jgi:hypothetical protein
VIPGTHPPEPPVISGDVSVPSLINGPIFGADFFAALAVAARRARHGAGADASGLVAGHGYQMPG